MPKAFAFGRSIAALVCFVAALLATPAACASAAGQLYAPCGACHSSSAGGSLDGRIPSLAGQRAQYLERQITLFRPVASSDSAMQDPKAHPAFKNYQDIVILAHYLSSLPVNPTPVKGAGDDLAAGREVHDRICAGCHGMHVDGTPDSPAPRIVGQQYPYLRRQIEEGAELHMNFAPPEMTSALRGMSTQDKDAVADYLSRSGDTVASTRTRPPSDTRSIARP